MKPHLWLIEFIGLIVPRRLRADWRQEWESELRHRELLLADWDRLNLATKLDLAWRSLGAFWDALCLQPARLEDEMFQDLLLFRLQPQQGGYKDEQLTQFYQRLFERLDQLPGVQAATFGRIPLIADEYWSNVILLSGEIEQTAEEHETNRQIVRENYFAAMEIPFLRGRVFTARDDRRAPQVAIVSQAFERQFFPHEDALGKHVRVNGTKRDIEIVGVVADSKYMSQREEIKPLMYTPWQQESGIGEMYFALRTLGEPTALAAPVREAVRELDSNLPLTEVTTQTARAQTTLGQERLYVRLLGFFGALALVLASIGLSGVLAYSVAQRTNEIGIRMAFGAQPANVSRMVVSQGMKLVVLGLAVGASSGYALTRLLASDYFGADAWQRQVAKQLYGVESTDPLTFGLITSVLTIVALAACWRPARKAAQVDPMVALRQE